MKTNTLALGALAAAALAAALYGAYRAGMQHAAQSPGANAPAAAEGAAATDAGPQKPGDIDPATGRRVLYWHDPMVPDKKFDRPGKSPFMDMMLVPVLADSGSDEGSVTISPRLQQSLGVRVVAVGTARLAQGLTAPGTIAWNDRDVAVVSTRVGGTVEKLHVRAPLDPVRAGQPVAELYVPDWIAPQEEYLAVARLPGHDLQPLLDAARTRMLIAGMPDEVIDALQKTGTVQRRITLIAPRGGVVAELGVREGANVAAGTMLMRINSLSTVWINAEVPETAAATVRPGMKVTTRLAGAAGGGIAGTVAAILPELNTATRTIKVRIEAPNPGGRLRPGMFATIDFGAASAGESLVVPSESVIRTGRRSVVIVADASNHFQAVDVETGIEADGRTEILRGLASGQRVVASGQFLIDSEASLKSALERMTEPAAPPASATTEYSGTGVIESVAKDGVMLSHEPIPALHWGPMTMEFRPPKGGLPAAVTQGARVNFRFRTTTAGEYELTEVEPAAPAPAAAKAGAKGAAR